METESINQFYVYVHRRASDLTPFYVGKGKGLRAWRKWGRSDFWKRVAAKHGVVIEILAAGLSEESAFILERATIQEIGRGALCNLTDGGEGNSGHSHTDETKSRISAAHVGKKKSPEAVAKSAAAKKGKPHSAETKARMSAVRKGRTHSAEAIQKMRDKANARRPETIQKQVESNTGKKRSDEAKKNMAKAQQGKPVTCSNGITFPKVADAVVWLKENGSPKASVSAITRACRNPKKVAYGYGWRFA